MSLNISWSQGNIFRLLPWNRVLGMILRSLLSLLCNEWCGLYLLTSTISYLICLGLIQQLQPYKSVFGFCILIILQYGFYLIFVSPRTQDSLPIGYLIHYNRLGIHVKRFQENRRAIPRRWRDVPPRRVVVRPPESPLQYPLTLILSPKGRGKSTPSPFNPSPQRGEEKCTQLKILLFGYHLNILACIKIWVSGRNEIVVYQGILGRDEFPPLWVTV